MSTENTDTGRPYLVEAIGTFLLVLLAGAAVCIGRLPTMANRP